MFKVGDEVVVCEGDSYIITKEGSYGIVSACYGSSIINKIKQLHGKNKFTKDRAWNT